MQNSKPTVLPSSRWACRATGIDVEHPGPQPDRVRGHQPVVHRLPQRSGAPDRIRERRRRRRRAAGQPEHRDVARRASAAQRGPFVVDVVQRQCPHLAVVGLEELVVEPAAEVVAVVVGQMGDRGVGVQIRGQLGELLLDGRGQQALRPVAVQPHPTVAGDVVEADTAGLDRAVEIGEMTVQHMPAQIPGESGVIGDRCGHPAQPVPGIHHEMIDPEFGEADRGADAGRSGTHYEKRRHRSEIDDLADRFETLGEGAPAQETVVLGRAAHPRRADLLTGLGLRDVAHQRLDLLVEGIGDVDE